jgi:murein DD-endopeptidase MepM/ murein hydrolase activator NlpD
VSAEVTERGVATVAMKAFIIDLSTRRILITVNLGWVHTGRLVTVAWPPSARLPAGVYRVKISAHDHHNGNLLRTATSSDVATLTVKAPAKAPAPAPQPEVPAGEASGYPTPAQTVADGAVFPVQGPHNFGGPENRFGAPREGHIHEGQDVLTAEGTPDVVPLAGTIESTSFQAGGAGYYVVEHTTYGLDFMFAHCEAGSFTVHEGETVAAGAQICRAGQTGDATTPHLHFEVWVDGPWQEGGHPIDPLPYLEAWERG